MNKYILSLFLYLIIFNCNAQENDTLFAVKKGNSMALRYKLKNRETLSMLAQRFYTTLTEIEANNEFDKKKVAPGDYIFIPLTNSNYYIHKPALELTDLNKLYYRVHYKEDMQLLLTYFRNSKNDKPMTKDELRNINDMHGYNLVENQPLFIGWIRMLPKDSINVAKGYGYPQNSKTGGIKDTIKHYFGGLDAAFNVATSNGLNVLSEKGTAVFFDKPGKSNVYYALHNTTPRNTIIKVVNPGNNRTIFVKVIGSLPPDSKIFSNCIIGICNAAKEDLGVSENRVWVELSYPVN